MYKTVKNSLQLKLIMSVIIVTSVIQMLFTSLKIKEERESALKQMALNQDRIVNELAHGLTEPLWNFDITHAKTLIELKLREPDFVGIVIHDLEMGAPGIGMTKNRDGKITENLNPRFEEMILKSIDIKKNGIAFWKADCYFTDRYVQEIIYRSIMFSVFTILGLTSVLTLLLITALNFLIANPIQKITSKVNSIAKGDLSKRIQVRQTDEIGKIGNEFNSLLDQLQMAISEVNQVMAAMAAGDFSRRITVHLEGDLNKLKMNTNRSIEILGERTEQLKQAQQAIIEKAHKAGMADVASGTLHNVGNILNSVKVSAQLIKNKIKNSKINKLKKANDLLRENLHNLDEFILRNPKGKKLLEYYLKLEEVIFEEAGEVSENLNRLNDKIDMIADVVSAQQSYAGISSLTESYPLETVIEDALTLQSGSIGRYGIQVIKNYAALPEVPIQKAKLVHILINLIKNAKESMLETPVENRKLTISTERNEDLARLVIKDTGKGIEAESLKKIFTHGYTTKKDGHGFGLHSCANYMMEMNGNIWAESEGIDKGASFILEFKLPMNIT